MDHWWNDTDMEKMKFSVKTLSQGHRVVPTQTSHDLDWNRHTTFAVRGRG
jgi:hypothetical protein